MKRKSAFERFMEMTDAERDAYVAKYDREEISLKDMKPLTKADQALLARAVRKPGRPKVGQGAKRVLVSIERSTLAQADAVARKLHISRSELIGRGIREVVAKVA